MKSISKLLIAGSAAIAMVGTAAAQAAGSVQSASSEAGSVVVVRDGEIYSIGSGDQVFPGDVISTRSSGSATVSAYGCTISLDGSEEVTVGETMCEGGAVRTASSGGGDGAFEGNTGPLILGAAGVATVAAIASDDDDDDPVSP